MVADDPRRRFDAVVEMEFAPVAVEILPERIPCGTKAATKIDNGIYLDRITHYQTWRQQRIDLLVFSERGVQFERQVKRMTIICARTVDTAAISA